MLRLLPRLGLRSRLRLLSRLHLWTRLRLLLRLMNYALLRPDTRLWLWLRRRSARLRLNAFRPSWLRTLHSW